MTTAVDLINFASMNLNRTRGFLATLAGAVLIGLAGISQAGFTLEWDPAPPEYGNVDYTVEKANENDSPIVWTAVATTAAPVMGFSTNPSPGDMYRLRIRNIDNGISVVDPAVIKPHPPANLNFRLRDSFDETAAVTDENDERLAATDFSGEADAMLAAFEAAIAAPDPETPSFNLFEAFLDSQARGETPFAPPAPERPGDLVALFRQG